MVGRLLTPNNFSVPVPERNNRPRGFPEMDNTVHRSPHQNGIASQPPQRAVTQPPPRSVIPGSRSSQESPAENQHSQTTLRPLTIPGSWSSQPAQQYSQSPAPPASPASAPQRPTDDEAIETFRQWATQTSFCGSCTQGFTPLRLAQMVPPFPNITNTRHQIKPSTAIVRNVIRQYVSHV
jgi:hypothetical protein